MTTLCLDDLLHRCKDGVKTKRGLTILKREAAARFNSHVSNGALYLADCRERHELEEMEGFVEEIVTEGKHLLEILRIDSGPSADPSKQVRPKSQS